MFMHFYVELFFLLNIQNENNKWNKKGSEQDYQNV